MVETEGSSAAGTVQSERSAVLFAKMLGGASSAFTFFMCLREDELEYGMGLACAAVRTLERIVYTTQIILKLSAESQKQSE